MLFPDVLPRVEERGDRACCGINTREIYAFVSIASVAGQGEVCRIVLAAVFAGNDVLNVESRKREMLLREQTVLATMARSATDAFANRCVHQLCGRLPRRIRAFACKIPMRSIAST